MCTVLANRPYQYGRWMIILQQWEPIISPYFPSQIPFWISLKGIPLHFWDEKIIRDIGQELGELEHYTLTKTTARVRVMMDGLKPLPQDTILKFSGGEECVIALEYEKLENFCTYCLKLSHLERTCPDKPPTEIREYLKMENSHNSVEGPQRSNLPSRNQFSNHQHTERTSPPVRHAREATAFQHRVDRHGNPFGERAATYQSRAPPLKNKIAPTLEREPPRCSGTERSPTRRNEVTENSPQYSTCRTGPNRRHLNQNTTSPTEQQWRVKDQRTTRSGNKELTTGQGRLPLERNLDREDFPPPQHLTLPQPRSTEEVMEELRDATYQYMNVADHVESAVHKQRVLSGEAYGLMEKTAAGIVEAECAAQAAQQTYLVSTIAAVTQEEEAMEIELTTVTIPLETSQPPQQSKRRGRPPKVFKGSNSRKRNIQISVASPANTTGRASTPSGQAVKRKVAPINGLAGTNTTDVAGPSSTTPLPHTRVFPASNRQARDIPRQTPPLP